MREGVVLGGRLVGGVGIAEARHRARERRLATRLLPLRRPHGDRCRWGELRGPPPARSTGGAADEIRGLPALPDPRQAALGRVALMLFNDAILRTAFEIRAGVIDLRLVCGEPSDYANPIEPSGSGGLKIARAVARAAEEGG